MNEHMNEFFNEKMRLEARGVERTEGEKEKEEEKEKNLLYFMCENIGQRTVSSVRETAAQKHKMVSASAVPNSLLREWL